MNYVPLDVQALCDVRNKNIGDFYALRHKESGLFFHKKDGLSSPKAFVAKYPMYKRKGVWTSWLKFFEKPEDWELVVVLFEGKEE